MIYYTFLKSQCILFDVIAVGMATKADPANNKKQPDMAYKYLTSLNASGRGVFSRASLVHERLSCGGTCLGVDDDLAILLRGNVYRNSEAQQQLSSTPQQLVVSTRMYTIPTYCVAQSKPVTVCSVG